MKIEVNVSPKADIPTINNRVYPHDSLEKAIVEYNKTLPSLGWVNSVSPFVDREVLHAAYIVHNVDIDVDGAITATIELLTTVDGNKLKALIASEAAVSFGVSSLATIDNNIVKIDKIVSIDAYFAGDV